MRWLLEYTWWRLVGLCWSLKQSPRHCLVILYRYRFMRFDKYLYPYFTFCSVFIITNIVVFCYGHCLSSVALCVAVENINWAYICVDMILENPISYIWNSYGNSFKWSCFLYSCFLLKPACAILENFQAFIPTFNIPIGKWPQPPDTKSHNWGSYHDVGAKGRATKVYQLYAGTIDLVLFFFPQQSMSYAL